MAEAIEAAMDETADTGESVVSDDDLNEDDDGSDLEDIRQHVADEPVPMDVGDDQPGDLRRHSKRPRAPSTRFK